ncbi:Pantothenate:Na+ symporter [Fulvivirga imtechensis AK7]|uniref:Pantothenate:Na+ symporter n=1 Tax=Fulvivirga imtechensis AK7 TaxID=1237149 RepID=L8JNX4_9BACT|nr:Pantothenate:Na+ symporter [Fulvivirga imtechensis]ELR70540.1 Pantothenate:Na+ symporter [Fulvivirga imtechensis AK7]
MNDLASNEQIIATWVLIIVYIAVVLLFVIRGARRTQNISDYALGTIGFSPVAVGLALAASMTSAATFIINPGFIALYGISGVISFAVVMPLAIYISLIVMTKGFRKYGATVKALTMAQWIGKMYNSQRYSIFFAFLSFLLITFIVLICVGLTQVLSSALNAEPVWVLAAVIAFVFGYMMFGGANSLVYTNAIQATLMLVVAIILLSSGTSYFEKGIDGFIGQLQAIDEQLVKPVNPDSFLFRDYFEIIFCQFIIGIAIVCQPHIMTKSLLLKKDSDVNKYLTVSIITLIIFFAVVFTGLYVRLYFPDLTVNGEPMPMDSLISAYVVSKFPVYVGIMVILGLISAGLSTLEGLVQSLSTTITADLLDPLVGKHLGFHEHKKQVFINKMVIVALAFVSFGLSYEQLKNPNLSVAIFAQNGVYAYFSAAFVPVLFGTFLKKSSLTAVFSASITAIIVHFGVYYGQITPYMKEPVNNPAIASTFAILSSLLVGGVIYYFSLASNKREEKVYVH